MTRPWALWMLFFFQYAGIGVYFTYLNVYFRAAGLTGTQIGIINMTTALFAVGAATLWGFLSDRTGQTRLLIAVGAVGALVVNQFIPLAHTFEAFLGLACLSSLTYASVSTLSDSFALALLGDRREDYGRYRLGGTFGYIVTAGISGFVFDRTGLQMMFPAFGVIMVLFAVTALLLPAAQIKGDGQEPAKGKLGVMMRQPAWMLFTLCLFLCWVATNASIMFLPVTLQAMGADSSLIGVAVTVPAIFEIPFMLYSGALLRRFGPIPLMLVAMGMMVVRYFLLGIMPVPSWAIGINIINGPAFVFFWNSAILYANRMAPPSLKATAQGMINSTTGLAGMLSSLLTGWLFDNQGPNGMFLVMAGFCLVALILFGVGNLAKRAAPTAQVPPGVG